MKTSVLSVILVVLGLRKGLIWPHRFEKFSPIIKEMGLAMILGHCDFILNITRYQRENLPIIGIFPVVLHMGTSNTRGPGCLINNLTGGIKLFKGRNVITNEIAPL